MPPAARIGDFHTCPQWTGNVPHVGGPVMTGAYNVLICGQPAARLGDRTAHGGVIVVGCPAVLIGSVPGAGCLSEAAKKGTPFVDMGQPAPETEDTPESGCGLAPESGSSPETVTVAEKQIPQRQCHSMAAPISRRHAEICGKSQRGTS